MRLAVAVLLFLAACAVQARPLGLTISREGVLQRDGKPYRGIGVNYFNGFYRCLIGPQDGSGEAGLHELATRGIPFARFMCGGFWPSEMSLYRTDRREYLRRLDRFIRAAEKEGVGLIPSLFWNLNTVPDLVGESCDQWGNRASKTHAFMREYIQLIVGRYRNSPAIWGWEFGNEYNLGADLPNASDFRPAIVPSLGTPSTRSARDELSHAMVRTALKAFAEEVRKLDRTRIIVTGNAFPRPTAWHQMTEKSWTADTAGQRAEMLANDSPDPNDMLCVHAYEDYPRIPETMEIARTLRKPLFVGEFGVPGAPTEASRARFADLLKTIETSGVPLAALWAFDNGGQDDWSVTGSNARSYQLEMVAQAHARVSKEVGRR